MNAQRENGSLDHLIDALVAWAGTGALILDHMNRAADRGHGDGSPTRGLESVLRSALGALRDRHPALDLAAAAAVIADVVETVGDEVFLVDLEATDGEN